jgi:hypothetical protein
MSIKEQFFNTFGEYPVLHIEEHRACNSDIPSENFPFTDNFVIDTEKLDKLNESTLMYVMNILEGIAKNDKNYQKGYTSYKYSFSDSSDWWDDILADEDDYSTRKHVYVDMEVCL